MYKTLLSLVSVTLLCVSAASFSQSRDERSFSISKGEVTVTPSFCPGQCTATDAELSGSFTGFLPGGGTQLFFTESSVTTNPDIGFQLPEDPNFDSGGTNREISFSFDGTTLEVKGSIDSRAFDGPLTEYSFSAEVDQSISTGFDQQDFYTARPDFRKCVSPLCGGYFVKRVNQHKTLCADGTLQKECYVAELQNSPALGSENGAIFNDRNAILLQGKILPKEFDLFGNLGVFQVNDAYKAVTAVAGKGRYVGLENNGISCISSPCFSYDEYVLNRDRVRVLSTLDLDQVGASEEQLDEAREILSNEGVLLAAGFNRRYEGFEGTGVRFTATQFFLPIKSPVIQVCQEGYLFEDGACRTPYGCIAPQFELTGTGGIPIVDPTTGEVSSIETKSCVDSCEIPAFVTGPGQCAVFFP